MDWKEFPKRNWLKILILSVVFYFPVVSITDANLNLRKTQSFALSLTSLFFITIILCAVGLFFWLKYIQKIHFLRFEWKKVIITIILFIAFNWHITECDKWELTHSAIVVRPCGMVSDVEELILPQTLTSFINFAFLALLPISYLLACVAVNLPKKIFWKH